MKNWIKYVIVGISLAIGVCVLILGLTLIWVMPMIIHRQVESELPLKEGSTTTKMWQNPPYDMSMQFWIFNVTNPNEILQGSKPRLQQKGPYGFKEVQSKQNVVYTSNYTVKYYNNRQYFFDPALSCPTCQLEDTFIIPNVPYLSILKMVRSQTIARDLLKLIVDIVLRIFGEHPFVSDVTAGQLLFEGYQDRILDMVSKFKPGLMPNRMGIMYGKNDTNDGLYEILTGVNDAYRTGRIVNWEDHSSLEWKNWWNANYTSANMINGSDGSLQPPFINRADTLRMFARDICRSIYIKYVADVSYGALKTYRFRIPPEAFAVSEENLGFCWPTKELYYSQSIQPELDGGWCLPSGMLDISHCQNGAPIVVSMPQFMYCPDEVMDSVSGLSSPAEEFLTHIDIEPTTGVLLAAVRKIQLNVAMYSDPTKANVFQKMKPVILPLLWLNESAVMNATAREVLYNSVVNMPKNAYIGAYIATGVGSFAVLLVLIAILVMVLRKEKTEEHHGNSYTDVSVNPTSESPSRSSTLTYGTIA